MTNANKKYPNQNAHELFQRITRISVLLARRAYATSMSVCLSVRL